MGAQSRLTLHSWRGWQPRTHTPLIMLAEVRLCERRGELAAGLLQVSHSPTREEGVLLDGGPAYTS